MRKLWSRILRRLDIAQASRVAEDNEQLSEMIAELRKRENRRTRAHISDLLRLAHKIDPALGNKLKVQWASVLQEED